MDIGNLATIAAAFFVAAASPGPATIAVASVSINSDRKSGLVFGLGLAVGLAVWGLVAAAGLGAILQTSNVALTALKVLGGIYLLWLAFKSARAATTSRHISPNSQDKRRHFFYGLVLNLSNPKAVFAWMAALALGLNAGSGAGQVALATGICMCLGFLIYSVYAFAFSTPGAMLVYSRARRWVDGAVAGLFAVAGIALIKSAFARQ